MRKNPRLTIDILTIFPRMFSKLFDESLIGKARDKGILDLRIFDIRKKTVDKHHTVDDKAFGGGAGMVMKIEPIVRMLRMYRGRKKPKIILLSPQGEFFSQQTAQKLAREKHIVLICGHYEGIDERISRYVDTELSIGDVVLTGGEIPAMIVVDAVARLVPGVVKEKASIENDSFFNGRLDYPQYTRPAVFKGMAVPNVLLSGNHAKIAAWRKKMSLKNTLNKRPDLFTKHTLKKEEKIIIKEV